MPHEKVRIRRKEFTPFLQCAATTLERERTCARGRFIVDAVEFVGHYTPLSAHEPLPHPDDDATGFIGDPDPNTAGAID